MFKNPQIDPILEKAKRWAEKAWMEASVSWSERPPAYRKYVVEPSISKIIKQLDLNKSSSIVEIGCGNGWHILFWRQELDSLGLEEVSILGIDLLESLINKAKRDSMGYKNLHFEVCDVTMRKTVKLIIDKVGNPDVIIAMFLLHNVPDLEGVLRTVTSVLKNKGHFIAVFVHPNFAEHLLQLGHVKVVINNRDIPKEYISPSGVVQWRFRGYYPIAQENRPPFYVPYFHHFLQDYYNAFKMFGLEIKKKIPLIPDQNIAERLEGEDQRLDERKKQEGLKGKN